MADDQMPDDSFGTLWCLFAWRDGWGDHQCHLRAGHGPSDHRCECDQTERYAQERSQHHG
jgi:hypothetical protein